MTPFVIVILCALLIYSLFWLKRQPAAKRPRATLKLLFIIAVVFIVILTITGRLHWFGAALLTALIFVKKYSFLLLRVFPFLRTLLRGKTKKTAQQPNNGSLSRQEALDILGVPEGASHAEIIAAHKRLMQKLHPDQGGSNFLASQINQARDTLLKE